MKLPRNPYPRLPARLRPKPHNKYGVSPPAERTLDGILYASKAEAWRARDLNIMVEEGKIQSWDRQVRFQLGPDFTYRADFVVHHTSTKCKAEDVKGVETSDFRRVRRLWKKYGVCPLVILTRVGRFTPLGTQEWDEEEVEGGMDATKNQG